MKNRQTNKQTEGTQTEGRKAARTNQHSDTLNDRQTDRANQCSVTHNDYQVTCSHTSTYYEKNHWQTNHGCKYYKKNIDRPTTDVNTTRKILTDQPRTYILQDYNKNDRPTTDLNATRKTTVQPRTYILRENMWLYQAASVIKYARTGRTTI